MNASGEYAKRINKKYKRVMKKKMVKALDKLPLI